MGIEKCTNPWESCLAKVYANPYKEAGLKALEHIAK
jgi:hypothetical protein